MAKELIQVELIENPAVKRTMTVASFQNNQNKWRLVGSSETSPPSPQKKSAAPVAVADTSSEFVADPAATEPSAPTPPESVQAPDLAPSGVIDGMRAQYKALAGSDADGRWGVKKLSEEIKKLETPAQ